MNAVKPYLVTIDYKRGPSFEATFHAFDKPQAINDAVKIAIACGFVGAVKKTKAKEVVK